MEMGRFAGLWLVLVGLAVIAVMMTAGCEQRSQGVTSQGWETRPVDLPNLWRIQVYRYIPTGDCFVMGYREIAPATPREPNGGEIDWDYERSRCWTAKPESAPPVCATCGATTLVGYTIDKKPGPFCRACWEALKVHVAGVLLSSNPLVDEPLSLPAVSEAR